MTWRATYAAGRLTGAAILGGREPREPLGSRASPTSARTPSRARPPPCAGDRRRRGRRRPVRRGPERHRLQERVAALLGKEAALLVPTGTMANQLALKLYCRPGDDVIVGVESHAVVARDRRRGRERRGPVHRDRRRTAGSPPTSSSPRASRAATCSTRRRRSSRSRTPRTARAALVWDRAELERIGAAAREHGVASYLDGARLLNAAVGARRRPGGARRAVRPRLDRAVQGPRLPRRLGARGQRATTSPRSSATGGCSAARCASPASSPRPALHALDHHVDRLAEDHANARVIGERLAALAGVELDLDALETNIVVFHLRDGAPDAADRRRRARPSTGCSSWRSARARSARSPISTSRAPTARRAAEALAEAVA